MQDSVIGSHPENTAFAHLEDTFSVLHMHAKVGHHSNVSPGVHVLDTCLSVATSGSVGL